MPTRAINDAAPDEGLSEWRVRAPEWSIAVLSRFKRCSASPWLAAIAFGLLGVSGSVTTYRTRFFALCFVFDRYVRDGTAKYVRPLRFHFNRAVDICMMLVSAVPSSFWIPVVGLT